jgi:hypothetical protein
MKKILLFALATATVFSAGAQTFNNAGFENWHSFTVIPLQLEAPNTWHGTDSLLAAIAPLASLGGIQIDPQKQLFKSSTAHSGSFSAEVRSANIGETGGNVPGVFSNAKIGVDIMGLLGSGAINDPSQILQYLSYSEATPVSGQVGSVTAWVKLDDTNQDEAMISVFAVKTVQGSTGDSTAIVGIGTHNVVPGVNQFTEVTVPVVYATNEQPEKLIVAFLSSDYAADSVHEGNAFFVDDVSFTYSSTSIRQPLLSEQQLLVYPNPSTGQVYFNLNATARPEEYSLTIADVTGRIVYTEQLHQQVNNKDMSDWGKGHYFYTLTHTKSGLSEKGKFVLR